MKKIEEDKKKQEWDLFNKKLMDYNLPNHEKELIKQDIPEGSRTFLVKQGNNSVVAQLDLKGFDFELAVLSGRKSNIELVHQLLKTHGPAPDAWLPNFREQWNSTWNTLPYVASRFYFPY